GAAATDVGHRFIDVTIGWLWSALEQCRRRHDLPRLAVAALRHVERRPRLLHGVRGVGGEAFDGDDPVGGVYVRHADRAGALHLIVDVQGAGAALRDAAAVLRAGEADLLADDPQKRGVGLDLDVADSAIDVELSHERPLRLRSNKIACAAVSCRLARGDKNSGPQPLLTA